ncbi:hypothetical protein T492DRAFT_349950 [Pavlovales sp. CCMP2436]|nr:hypothetical protein T492DRAFT_349950 [Pavlovales sp. CCMP2436]
MSPTVAVSFSLPAVHHLADGTLDANGLCTIQLLIQLANAHNALLALLGVDAAHLASTLTHRTPPVAARAALVIYRREKLLEQMHAHNGDFRDAEGALRRKLLSSATPVEVVIEHYSYAGEIHRSGLFARLRARVAQRPLPVPVLDALWVELDTGRQLARLTALVEEATRFASAVGGGADARAETPLQAFALEGLRMAASEWQACSTPSVRQHVRLCHLAALFLALEEGASGSSSLSQAVLTKYQQPLPAPLRRALLDAAPLLELSLLVPALRDLLAEQLTSDAWDAGAPLKQYIVYSSEHDLEAEPWWPLLPEQVQLAQAMR